MLRLRGGQVESLWDELLPEKLRALPDELAQLDASVRDEALLAPIAAHRDREAQAPGRAAQAHGRPTLALPMDVRSLVLEHRDGCGEETPMRALAEALQLRRCWLVASAAELPEEATLRKLTRRLGAALLAELARLVSAKAQRQTRLRARAVRIDSTLTARARKRV